MSYQDKHCETYQGRVGVPYICVDCLKHHTPVLFVIQVPCMQYQYGENNHATFCTHLACAISMESITIFTCTTFCTHLACAISMESITIITCTTFCTHLACTISMESITIITCTTFCTHLACTVSMESITIFTCTTFCTTVACAVSTCTLAVGAVCKATKIFEDKLDSSCISKLH